jgi:D-3-phosphoglycerate dehydrogenase
MVYKILSTSPTFGYYALEPVDYLKNHGCTIELTPQIKKLSEDEIVQKVKDLDAMIVGIEKITDKVIAAAQKVKIIAKHGAGVDNIDMKAASSKGIVVTSAPGANSDAVADHDRSLLSGRQKDSLCRPFHSGWNMAPDRWGAA